VLGFAHIASCLDLSDEDIQRALAPAKSFSEPSPRARTLALITHLTEIATPNSGAPNILLVAAHLATRDWLEGDLIVRLIGDAELSVLELLVDDGVSRERIAGPLRIDVPLAEFRETVAKRPEDLVPLVRTDDLSARRITLRAARHPQSRPPKLSAFASGLMPAVAGRTAQPKAPRDPLTFEKAVPTLVFDDDKDTGGKTKG
jgi:hypothetical protein